MSGSGQTLYSVVTRLACVLSAVVVVFGASAGFAQADVPTNGDWPLARGNSNSTGAVAKSLPSDLQQQWEFTAKEAIEATPVIANGFVYVADVMGGLYSLRLSDGKPVWQKSYDTIFLASPAIRMDDAGKPDLFVIGDVDGNVVALDVKSGEEKWKHVVGGEVDGSVNFFEGDVLVTSQDGSLVRLSGDDGSEVWKYETNDQIRCSPTLAGNNTFLGGCDGMLHVVDVTTGKSAGEPMSLEGPTGSTVSVIGDQAYLPTMGGMVLGFNWRTGTKSWEYADDDRMQEYRNSAAVTEDIVVLASQYKQVDAINTATGKRMWTYKLRRRADASPVIAGDDVWIAATDGRLIRLNLKDGSETWQREYRGGFIASPAIVADQIILADDKGKVWAMGPKS